MHNITKLTPNSYWIVEYECRLGVVKVDRQGTGFFAPGQDAPWVLSAAHTWIKEIDLREQLGEMVDEDCCPWKNFLD